MRAITHAHLAMSENYHITPDNVKMLSKDDSTVTDFDRTVFIQMSFDAAPWISTVICSIVNFDAYAFEEGGFRPVFGDFDG